MVVFVGSVEPHNGQFEQYCHTPLNNRFQLVLRCVSSEGHIFSSFANDIDLAFNKYITNMKLDWRKLLLLYVLVELLSLT